MTQLFMTQFQMLSNHQIKISSWGISSFILPLLLVTIKMMKLMIVMIMMMMTDVNGGSMMIKKMKMVMI